MARLRHALEESQGALREAQAALAQVGSHVGAPGQRAEPARSQQDSVNPMPGKAVSML